MGTEHDTEALALIAAERQRQIDAEGYTPEHDDRHAGDGLAWAAVTYAAPVVVYRQWPGAYGEIGFRPTWPWQMRAKRTPHDRVRELVKAGALIVAEIERLQRAAAPSE